MIVESAWIRDETVVSCMLPTGHPRSESWSYHVILHEKEQEKKGIVEEPPEI